MNLRNSWKDSNKNVLHTESYFTKTTLFLLPILGYTYRDFFINNKNYLHNCYISDLDKPKMYCVFDNSEQNDSLTIVQNRLIGNYSFVSRYFDNDNLELVYSFNLGSDFEDDFYKFLDGQYSKLSKDLKDILIFCYGKQTDVTNFKSTIYEAIYPTDDKRITIAKALGVEVSEIKEVFDKPDIRVELYKKYEDLINE